MIASTGKAIRKRGDSPAVIARRENKPRNRARRLISAAKRRAKKSGLLVTITVEDIAPIIERGVCEATGIPFVLSYGEGAHPYTPSIDQINPHGGYTPDNIQLVVYIYNVCKNVWGHETVIEFAEKLLERKSIYPKQSSQSPIKPRGLDPSKSFLA